ncbi:leucine-rich repeat domain-containing protein [Bacillus cereus]|uniref:Leucine-rich repeat domain-containing protein n=1 Tax=Bacillus cereus TaxID=1396 RepID=A0AB34D4C3_BACCE|nr:leucine-rich repeat domain-containing protein [Bacillus cereus]KAB2496945.1 leucine-rich repeat domain-containing protein [Bacillus cereus]
MNTKYTFNSKKVTEPKKRGDSLPFLDTIMNSTVTIFYNVFKNKPIDNKVSYKKLLSETQLKNTLAKKEIIGTIENVFPDKRLANIIASTLDKKTEYSVNKEELETLTSLFLSKYNVKNLSGLEYLINLHTLDLSDNQISDISPLSSLLHLSTLYLARNQISDISPLSGLLHLKLLDLSDNRISDVSPLSSLLHLSTLYSARNQISDISPLSGLLHLNSLDLSDNRISDVSPLSKLLHLNKLYLARNQISNTSPLSGLLDLSSLYLAYNQVSDVNPLSSLINLSSLDLSGNQINDLHPLSLLSHSFIWAVGQSIKLEPSSISKPTTFALFDKDGYSISASEIRWDKGKGTLVNESITWDTPGENKLTWHRGHPLERNFFSGTLEQYISEKHKNVTNL